MTSAVPGETQGPFNVRGRINVVGPDARVAVKGAVEAENLPLDVAGGWLPSDHNLKAWTYDPAMVQGGTNSSLAGGNKVKLDRINVRQAVQVTTAYIWTVVAGANLTADQNYVGIYSAAGVLLWSSDADDEFVATAGLQTFDLGSPLTLEPPFVWFAWLTNGGTAPQLSRLSTAAGGTVPASVGQGLAQARSLTVGGAVTVLPSSFAPGTGALNFAHHWAGLS